MRHRRLLLILSAAVSLLLASPPVCAQDASLDDLTRLFETDPAAAFVKAAELFEEPWARGDVEGMMGVLRLATDWAVACSYPLVAEDLLEAALAALERLGRWEALAELYARRASLMSGLAEDAAYPEGLGGQVSLRAAHCWALAQQAAAKAGRVPDAVAARESRVPSPDSVKNLRAHVHASYERDLREPCRSLFLAIDQATSECRDADALALMAQVLNWLNHGWGDHYNQWAGVFRLLAKRLWVRGSATLIPAMWRLVEANAASPDNYLGRLQDLQDGTWVGWSGLDDAFYRTQLRCIQEVLTWPQWYPSCVRIRFIRKQIAFRRYEEADRLAREFAVRLLGNPGSWLVATACVHARTPPDLRRLLWHLRLSAGSNTSIRWEVWNAMAGLPPDRQRELQYEAAAQALEAALANPDPEVRAVQASDAALLFKGAGRDDLAQAAGDLAKRLANPKPEDALPCALLAARSLAANGDWAGVVKTTEAAVGSQPPSVQLLEASLLLQEAYLHLGKLHESERWVAKSRELVNTLPLTPAEKANYLISMAGLCDITPPPTEGGKTGGK